MTVKLALLPAVTVEGETARDMVVVVAEALVLALLISPALRTAGRARSMQVIMGEDIRLQNKLSITAINTIQQYPCLLGAALEMPTLLYLSLDEPLRGPAEAD